MSEVNENIVNSKFEFVFKKLSLKHQPVQYSSIQPLKTSGSLHFSFTINLDYTSKG